MHSQTVEYALRAIVQLAYLSPKSATTDDLADVTKVPVPYLRKVLQQLRRSGLIESQRGIGGGVKLIAEPEEITILDVVNAVDPVKRIKTCPLDIKSHGRRLCPLHAHLDKAMAEVEDAYRNTTLDDVLREPSNSIPLCDIARSTKR